MPRYGRPDQGDKVKEGAGVGAGNANYANWLMNLDDSA